MSTAGLFFQRSVTLIVIEGCSFRVCGRWLILLAGASVSIERFLSLIEVIRLISWWGLGRRWRDLHYSRFVVLKAIHSSHETALWHLLRDYHAAHAAKRLLALRKRYIFILHLEGA